MAILLLDLLQSPHLLGRDPLTAEQLHHDEETPHPMDPRLDRYYQEIGEIIEQSPITSAGIRRS